MKSLSLFHHFDSDDSYEIFSFNSGESIYKSYNFFSTLDHLKRIYDSQDIKPYISVNLRFNIEKLNTDIYNHLKKYKDIINEMNIQINISKGNDYQVFNLNTEIALYFISLHVD